MSALMLINQYERHRKKMQSYQEQVVLIHYRIIKDQLRFVNQEESLSDDISYYLDNKEKQEQMTVKVNNSEFPMNQLIKH